MLDDSWDITDGGVVCRQLGFSGIRRITSRSSFGNVSANFEMDNVNCIGHETSLSVSTHSLLPAPIPQLCAILVSHHHPVKG